jgi:hypothetical protein
VWAGELRIYEKILIMSEFMLLEIAFAWTSNTSFRSLSPAVALDVCELFCASSENVRRPRKHPQSRSDLLYLLKNLENFPIQFFTSLRILFSFQVLFISPLSPSTSDVLHCAGRGFSLTFPTLLLKKILTKRGGKTVSSQH